MPRAFTVIDSFRVTATIRGRGVELPAGLWLVLEGRFEAASELPKPGAVVVVTVPSGQHHRASVSHAEVRHGSGAVSLAYGPEEVPRLSTVSVAEDAL